MYTELRNSGLFPDFLKFFEYMEDALVNDWFYKTIDY